MCFKCCLTLSLCFMYSLWLMTQSLSRLQQQLQAGIGCLHLCLPLSGWHCHHTDRYATAKDKQGWPVIWLSYPTPCTHPVEGHWRHGAEAYMGHSQCQCHLTFCLAVSVGRCCACCYGPGNFHCGKVKAVKWVASSHKMPQSQLRIMMCIWKIVCACVCSRGHECMLRMSTVSFVGISFNVFSFDDIVH